MLFVCLCGIYVFSSSVLEPEYVVRGPSAKWSPSLYLMVNLVALKAALLVFFCLSLLLLEGVSLFELSPSL